MYRPLYNNPLDCSDGVFLVFTTMVVGSNSKCPLSISSELEIGLVGFLPMSLACMFF